MINLFLIDENPPANHYGTFKCTYHLFTLLTILVRIHRLFEINHKKYRPVYFAHVQCRRRKTGLLFKTQSKIRTTIHIMLRSPDISSLLSWKIAWL